MALRGIIFDKDGTLLDYFSVWGPIFRSSIDTVLVQVGRSGDQQLKEDLLRMLGIGETGVHPQGLVFYSNSRFMMLHMWLFAKRRRISFRKLVQAFREGFTGSRELLKETLPKAQPAGDLHQIFRMLKDRGYTIGMVTTDTSESTHLCLDILGIRSYFDFISTYDDGYKKKPSPESFNAFCRDFSLSPSEVAVVGDAVVDFKYGKRGKAGYLIAVLTGSGDHRNLSKHAHVVYENVDGLLSDPVLFPEENPGKIGSGL